MNTVNSDPKLFVILIKIFDVVVDSSFSGGRKIGTSLSLLEKGFVISKIPV